MTNQEYIKHVNRLVDSMKSADVCHGCDHSICLREVDFFKADINLLVLSVVEVSNVRLKELADVMGLQDYSLLPRVEELKHIYQVQNNIVRGVEI